MTSVPRRYPLAFAVSTPIVLAAATCKKPVFPVSGVTRPRLIVRLEIANDDDDDDDNAVSMTTNNVTTTTTTAAADCVIGDVTSHVI